MNSSKKLSNPPSPSKRSTEVRQFVALNQQEFAELLTFIDFAEGFTIGFIEVNFPPDADLLIEALEKNPECQEIQFVTLDFSDPNLRFLRDGIVKILPAIQREPDKKLVLIVRGLAESIGVFGNYPPVLQDLNFVRDSYRKTVPHPILFILPDYAITRLAKFAPDFWAWRSGLFRFKTPQVTRDYAIERTLNSKEAIDEIPTPEKQERIDLLQRLLMEYNPTGQQATGENLRNYTNILHQLGVAYLSQRNSGKAREYLEEAVKLANGEESAFYAEVLATLGRVYYQQRQFESAKDCYQQSLKLSQKLEDRRSEATAWFYIGNIYLELREFQQARDCYQQCLEIEQEIDDRYSQAKTYHQLGNVAYLLQRFEEAQRYYQQALEIFVEFDDQYNQAHTFHQLGRISQDLQELEKARHYYQRALEIKIEYGERYAQASTYYCLGTLAAEQEDYAEAREKWQTALGIYVEFQDEYYAVLTWRQLARLPDN